MNHVKKSEGWDVYSVRANHEWATIAVNGWQGRGVDGRPREIGEIMIHSSYGSWAYQWGYLGQPFKTWLANTNDRSYIAGKFLGEKATVFDGEKTVRELQRDLLNARRQGDIEKEDARAIWDFIQDKQDEMEGSADLFVERMYDCTSNADWTPRNGRYSDAGPGPGARYFLLEPWERIATSPDRGFVGFWDTIMPVFQQALRDELQAQKEAA